MNKFNRRKRNFLQSNYSKSSSMLNVHRNDYNKITYDFLRNKSINSSSSNSNYFNCPLKQNDKSYNYSKSSSFHMNLSNGLKSPGNTKKTNYYFNNFSDLNPKLSFIQNRENKNKYPIKTKKGLLESRINNDSINNNKKNSMNSYYNNNSTINNNNTIISNNNSSNNIHTIITNNNSSSNSNKNSSKSNNKQRNVFRYNSFQNLNKLNTKSTRNKETKKIFLTKNESFINSNPKKNNYLSNRNISNSLIKYEISYLKNLNLSKSIESYLSKNKEYSRKNSKNKNNSNCSLSKNLSSASTDKFSVACDQITYKAAYQQTTHVTLQTISDEKLLKMCNNYIDTDESLEKFQRNFNYSYNINNKDNINFNRNNK